MAEFRYITETHQYFLGDQEIPGITRILADMGFSSFPIGEDRSLALDIAAARGIRVHLACHFYDEGDLDWDSVSVEDRPYVEAWVRFRDMTGFLPEIIERPACNEVYRFAGRPDVIGWIGEVRTVVERKTGEALPPDWVALQTAGQALLSPTPILRRLAVRLSKTGKPTLYEYTDHTDHGVFLGAVAGWWWKKTHGGFR